MKNITKIIFLLLLSILFTNCFDDLDDSPISKTDINDFVYRGMNSYYLYRENVNDLTENKQNSADYNDYLNGFSDPADLFESLIYNRETVDRFSVIASDYLAFEQLLQGTTVNNGMEFGLVRYVEGGNDIFGYVRYVLPSTSAESANLKRGDLFYAVNGTPLTISNWRSLLGLNNYTLNLATYNDNGTATTDDDSIDSTNETVSLNKVPYTENPVFKTKILQVESQNVGYLMYNAFTSNFDNELINAFSYFQANNVQHLVIDLRYNPGGSVNSATILGSLVAGEPEGQPFVKLQYNNLHQGDNTTYDFTNQGNSLNLNKVYVLATKSSASASELVINSLSAYLDDVIHIGTNTTGKSQASITLYDSPNFRRTNADPRHTYAMQPLVAISVNKNNDVVPADGLTPTIPLAEEINNLGILGDENEPLLAEALAHIASTNRVSSQLPSKPIKTVGDSNDLIPFKKGMYLDNE